MSRQNKIFWEGCEQVTARGRRVTIVDVARVAGTSVSSASVALRGQPGVSEQTRQHIMRTAARLGFQPDQRARMLRAHNSRLLGVSFSVAGAFHSELVEQLYAALAETQYDLVLSGVTATRTGLQATDSLLQDRCAALILISPAISEHDLASLSQRIPVVVLCSELHGESVDFVRTDDRRGVELVVERLVTDGHRDIHYVDGGGVVNSRLRRDGYLQAMASHGLADRVRVIEGGADEESGVAAATELLSRPALPTAVATYNDKAGFGLMLGLQSRGIKVPADISVVGYDDTRLAALRNVELTSVSQNSAVLAATAIECAIARAEAPHTQTAPTRKFVISPQMVLRRTSGMPRGLRLGAI